MNSCTEIDQTIKRVLGQVGYYMDTEDAGESQEALVELRTKNWIYF